VATHEWDAFGNLHTVNRGGTVTMLAHDPVNNRLLSASTPKAGKTYVYNYSTYDARHRIVDREASHGTSWMGMQYDDKDRLGFVNLGQTGPRTYWHDVRNNRLNQGSGVILAVNFMDQVTGRTLLSRGFGVNGTVRLGMGVGVEIFHSLEPGVAQSPSLNPLTGNYTSFFNVPASVNNGAAVLVDAKVRGTYTQAGQPTAIAEGTTYLRVPPMAEVINYDVAGRQIEDAFWHYTWDPAGRLTKKTAKLPAHPNASGETVDYRYDADNRRIQTTHTFIFTSGAQLRERSTVLWAGPVELCQILERTGKPTIRKWFQRGVDVSATSPTGAAGIGGLVAIHEETLAGEWIRTLLPINDGIGNVTLVLDATTGAQVASYHYGPFGEPLSETGEADACPFRWQTRWYDRESQQYYFLHRHYDPKIGRWLSMDPLREAGGFNVYAYCGNDPVNRHDPLGLADAPFSPGEMDENQALALREVPSFWELVILSARAGQLNSWLDQQSGEIAQSQEAIAGATAILGALDEEGQAFRRNMATSLLTPLADISGSTNYAELGAEWARVANYRGAQAANLQRLHAEAAPWFNESGELIGDLDGSGRIDTLAELNQRFTRVVGAGMRDSTFDLMNVGSAVQLMRLAPKALTSASVHLSERSGFEAESEVMQRLSVLLGPTTSMQLIRRLRSLAKGHCVNRVEIGGHPKPPLNAILVGCKTGLRVMGAHFV
jgi:RHS repeat-associated protein